MIFIDFYGAPEIFAVIQALARAELGRLLRVRPDTIVVRRIVTEGGVGEVELWVELSSEEQVFRRGGEIAALLAGVVREHAQTDVWVMFRVVPLSHAFLNGRPRVRGRLGSQPED